ncbi:MAG: hypothetical protein ABI685_06110 [Ferruginibacter sp.]
MKNKFSESRVESIMESLGGIQHAAAPNFFYTRLKAKMQPAEAQKKIFILRPAFITGLLSVLLIVNVVSLIKIDKKVKPGITVKSETPASIESFAKAYDMNTESVYE